ncbi:signal recognition particle-docking protein FtsY [Halodesulfurarchaeum sp.]|uniref:signal recognition particle-docking protein FtsY n=1 Tax=Halodesulfurarchaeum sp. TaxID=1980530 RepID=UPI002FC3A648
MFDGLKEKLGEFREDAADVAAEQATTEHEAQADSEAPDDSTATEDSTAGAPDGADESEGGPSLTDRAKSLATGKVILDAEDLEEPLWELELALLENDVEMSVAEEILDGIEAELVGEQKTITESTTGLIEEALREALFDVVSVGQFDFLDRLAATDKPAVIIFTGVNGVGKTTSIAKLATYLEEHGFSSVLANGDTYRAGANEQIEVHADRIDAPLISHEQGGDPAAVIYDAVEYANAHDIDVVLGDTAGRLHTSDGLMNQLAKIDRVVGPDMTLFVDEAVAGQDAVKRATEFNEAANIDGTVLTKADADTHGGAAISIASVTGAPILFLGTGQGYDDLEAFDPEALVEDLLGA